MELMLSFVAILIIAIAFTNYFSKAKDSTLVGEVSETVAVKLQKSRIADLVDADNMVTESGTDWDKLSAVKTHLNKL